MVFLAVVLSVVLGFVAFSDSSWSAEKVPSQGFRNVDEAIGWVKARGQCEQSASFCFVDIDLPRRSTSGGEFSPGWVLRGRLEVLTGPGLRLLRLGIARARTVSLSASDPTASLTVGRESSYDFLPGGKVDSYSTRVLMTSYKGEVLVDLAVPLPYPNADGKVGLENIELLTQGFGIRWNYHKP